MTHLRIELNEGAVEYVSSAVIKKLYDLATSGDLDVTSNLLGTLHTTATYLEYELAIETAFPHLHISADNYYILFLDPEVLRVLLALGIGDGVGITITQATNVNANSFEKAFKGNASIVSFNEFNYFTPLYSVPSEMFMNSTILQIDTSRVTSVGSNAFNKCANLQIELNMPNVTSMGYRAFYLSGITKISNMGNITGFTNSEVFGKCRSLTLVTLPSSFISLDNGTFDDCTSLRKINIDNIRSLGTAFFLVPGEFVMNFANLTTLTGDHGGEFTCNECRHLYAPKVTAGGGGFDLGGNNVRGMFVTGGWGSTRTNYDIVYFRDLSSVYTGCFCGGTILNLVINNTTPPTIAGQYVYQNLTNNKLFDDSDFNIHIVNIYVPDTAIQTYASDTYWSEADALGKLKPISELSKVATRELFDQLTDIQKKNTLIEEYM